jgi:hypothetical protein
MVFDWKNEVVEKPNKFCQLIISWSTEKNNEKK